MILNIGMQHRVLEYYQVCSNHDPGLTMTYFMARSNFPMRLLYGKKVKRWIVVFNIKEGLDGVN